MPLARNGYVYWTDLDQEANLKRVAVAGNTIDGLALRTDSAATFAVHNDTVIWADTGGAARMMLRMISQDGTVETLASPPHCGQSGPLVVDDLNVYWVISGCVNGISNNLDTIVKIPLDGSTASTLVTVPQVGGMRTIVSLSMDATHIYWSENGPGGQHAFTAALRRVAKGGGASQDIVIGVQYAVGQLAIHGGFLFFGDSNLSSEYRLRKVPVTGGAAILLATVPVTSSFDDVREIVTDGSRVFWTERSKVKSVPVAGGLVTDLTTGQDQTLSIALDGTEIYWLEVPGVGPPGRIKKVPKLGGVTLTVVDNLNSPSMMTISNGQFYFAENPVWNGGSRIARMALSGGIISTVVSGIAHGRSPFTADDSYIYVGDGRTLEKIPIEGGLAEQLAVATDFITNVVTDGAFVYWAEAHAIRKVPVNGGPVVDLSMPTPAGEILTYVTVANGMAYWIEETSSVGAIKKVSVNGGPVGTILSGQSGLSQLIADQDNVYFLQGPNLTKMSVNGGPLTPMTFEFFGLTFTQDSTHLYWTSFRGVFSVDKATGRSKTYEASIEGRGGLTVDDSSVYWYSEGSLWKATPK
jgi:hypothetical protein